jgi:hypothetical protein
MMLSALIVLLALSLIQIEPATCTGLRGNSKHASGIKFKSKSTRKSNQARSADRRLVDWEWGLNLEAGYPIIVDKIEANTTNDAQFLFNYTGDLTDTKLITVRVLQEDCKTAGDGAITSVTTFTDDKKIAVDVDIILSAISGSTTFFTELDGGKFFVGVYIQVEPSDSQ